MGGCEKEQTGMQTTLQVQRRVVKGYTYHRFNIPSKISKQLGLKAGDKVKVVIIGVEHDDTYW